MAFPTIKAVNELAVQRFGNALFNLQVGSETMDVVLDEIQAVGLNGALNFYFNHFFAGQSNAQVTETILSNFGIVEGQNGITAELVTIARDYIVGALNAAPAGQVGQTVLGLCEQWAGFTSNEAYGAAATAWNAEIAIATAYDGEADLVAGTVVPENTYFVLGANQDILNGTTGNDLFIADVVQVNGPQVNSLGTGDFLSGGLGFDSLEAQVTEGLFMGGGNMPIQPRTFSVDDIKLEALFSNIGTNVVGSGLNIDLQAIIDLIGGFGPRIDQDEDDFLAEIDDLLDGIISLQDLQEMDDTTVFVNAKNMDGVDYIWSFDSDADLVVQDLTTKDNGEVRNTSAMTVGMAYTGNSDHLWDASDFAVYFDQDYLLAGRTVSSSQANYWLLDEDSEDYVDFPLENIFNDGVEFTLDGVDYDLIVGQEAIQAGDWDDFAALLQAEIDRLVSEEGVTRLASVSVVVDWDNADQTYNDFGQLVTIPAVTLIDAQGGSFTDLGFTYPQGDTGSYDNYGRFDNLDSSEQNLLISVNVELEKVGRGGDGGELIIGGMNKGADNVWGEGSTTTPAGVEQFDIVVNGGSELPNSLASLRSTNNALQVVNIESEAGIEVGDAASLQIGNSNTDGVLGTLAGNAEALKDVQIFNAAAFKGDLTVYAALTGEVVDKYMDVQDIQADPAADNILFDYTLGQGDDYLNMVIDPANLATSFFSGNVGTTTREDFVLEINGGAGDDEIVFMIGDGEGDDWTEWYENSILNANLFINGGADDDIIRTPGAGNVIIDAGTGNDVVYTENTGVYPITGRMATWIDNADEDNLQDPESDDNDSYLLIDGVDINTTYQGSVTVTFMGFESTVNFTSMDDELTDLELNQLIKEAVNEDAVLSNLVEALDGPANSLVFQSLIDGEMDDYLLTDDNLYVALDDEVGTILDYQVPFAEFFGGPEYYGVDGDVSSDNIVTLGLGNDIAVLGTGEDCNDTLVYEGAGNGHDTIVNFETTSTYIDLVNTAHITSYTQGAAAVAGNAGTAIPEIFTLEVTAATGLAAGGGVINFNGGTVTIAAGATLAQVVQAFINPTVAYTTYTATAGATPSTVTFTETTPAGADIADAVVTDFFPGPGTPTVTGVLVGTVSVQDGALTGVVAPAAAITESFIVQFGDNNTPADSVFDTTYYFDGEEIPVLPNELGFNIAAAVANGSYANWTAVLTAPGADTVLFTSKTAGANVNDVFDTSFVGANIEVIVNDGLLEGYDMIDFTAYDVTAVVVEGQGVVTGALVANQTVIYFDESATNPFEYTVSEYAVGANGTLEPLTDTIVTAIGVLDFGTLPGDFAAENFII